MQAMNIGSRDFCCLSITLRNSVLNVSSSCNSSVGVPGSRAGWEVTSSRCEKAFGPFRMIAAYYLFVIAGCRFVYPPSLFEPAN
jgi:hypothetical protein